MVLGDEGEARTLQTLCEPVPDAARRVTLSSQPDGADADAAWVCHVDARVRPVSQMQPEVLDLVALRRDCATSVAPQAFYADFGRRGLDFGPGFRSLRQISRGDGRAFGEVVLLDEWADAGEGCLLHPVLLDGCLQLLAAALAPDGEDDLFLPIGIERYALFTAGIGARRCWSHVQLAHGEGRDTRRADLRVCDERGTVIAELRGLQLKRVDRDALARLGERWLDGCLYEMRWVEADPAQIARTSPEWDTAALTQPAEQVLPALARDVDVQGYDRFLERFDALCLAYTVQALRELGWEPASGESVDSAALARRLGVLAQHDRLFDRLLAILAEAGVLEPQGHGRWRVQRALPPVQPHRLAVELRAACPAGADAELEMTDRVATRLAEALRGEREPMDLLFPGGSLDTAERMYRDSPTARLYNGLLAALVAEAAAQRSAGRTLRILEIGAGTGGSTAHLLPRLQGLPVEYTFTDVGPLFVARARERFSASYPLRALRSPRSGARSGRAGLCAGPVRHRRGVQRHPCHGRPPAHARARSQPARAGRLAGHARGHGAAALVRPHRRPDQRLVGFHRHRSPFRVRDAEARALARPAGRMRIRGALSTAVQSAGVRRAVAAIAAAEPRRRCRRRHLAAAARCRGCGRGDGRPLARPRGRCVMVGRGAYGRSGDEATLSLDAADDLLRLLAELRSEGSRVSGVVHAWALDAVDGPPAGDRARAAALDALRLAQALVQTEPPPRLVLLTRDAQHADPEQRHHDAEAATLWGWRGPCTSSTPNCGRCASISTTTAAATARPSTTWPTACCRRPMNRSARGGTEAAAQPGCRAGARPLPARSIRRRPGCSFRKPQARWIGSCEPPGRGACPAPARWRSRSRQRP
ncbi:hypothetical protein FSC37_09640 [Piscinibacter aquaticus]|uniref:PKS/mFAS DH domain-containing protein n=1 Tax=Piscinibacter aquaticus TaxID=392597 RepID=A0A5C6U055_9BURK|nr:hypothetical protein FSC37_09640 [Piscinibacter aquaticus]